MKKLFLSTLVMLSLMACTSNRAKIDVTIAGAKDTCDVILYKLALNQMTPVDTFKVVSGHFKQKLEVKKGDPDFNYLFLDGVKIASFVPSPGEKIEIKTDISGKDISITGSEESIKFLEIEQQYSGVFNRFSALITELEDARSNNDKIEEKRIQTELGGVYVKQKQDVIRQLYKTPKSITSIVLLYQRISDELPIFADARDVLIFKMVYDSLQPLYPNSLYVRSLADDITKRENIWGLNNKINEAMVSGYPDISLPDQNSVVRTISDYEGKVILVSFWSITQAEHKMFNLELKKLYQKYHSRGFEIYQISFDADKTAWARNIKDQDLPWVSVHDALGASSQYLSLYNITSLPSIYIIDKEGSLVPEKELFDIVKLDALIGKLVR